jgi:hypothetical protein
LDFDKNQLNTFLKKKNQLNTSGRWKASIWKGVISLGLILEKAWN